jgi:hypothetical protein
MRHYPRAVDARAPLLSLNWNWPAGLTYMVVGLAQLARIDRAKTEFADLNTLNPNLAFVRTTLRRLYTDEAAVEHILDGLHKAGFE